MHTADDITTTGNIVATGTVSAGGVAVTSTGTTAMADATVSGTLDVTGATGVDDLTVGGAASVGETLLVTGVLTCTANPVFNGRPKMPTVLFANLGAATVIGQTVYCATGHGGLPGLLVADGTNWIAPDGATAAET